ncbi:MAG: hypothetical protein EB120_12065, partial [Proteobacteria bacterium]|nr:hypothetical protein [Pseudomonadota bacterium]
MSYPRAKISFPPSQEFLFPAVEFVVKYARQAELPTHQIKPLESAIEASLATVMNNNVSDTVIGEPIGLEIHKNEQSLVVEVINRGVPILIQDANRPAEEKLMKLASQLEGIFIYNHGRGGQTICLKASLEKPKNTQLSVLGSQDSAEELQNNSVTIRPMEPSETGALSQLFYHVYGYQYINEAVYYPERMSQMMKEGKLISFVAALKNGRLVGHVGLLQCNQTPLVFEPCLGVTDPRVKSRGLFSKLFQAVIKKLEQLPFQYCLIDFVTNHDYTQRFVSRYGTADL